jgi:hypothetical protein
LDWSEVGAFDPVFDLSQILISDLHGSEYELLVPVLIQVWHARVRELVLERKGYDIAKTDGYSLEVAFASILKAGMQRWTFLLAALNGFPQVSDAAIAYFAFNLSCWKRLFEKHVPPQHRVLGFIKV